MNHLSFNKGDIDRSLEDQLLGMKLVLCPKENYFMPELPEVENVCQSLSRQLNKDSCIKKITWSDKDLRFPLPKKNLQSLRGLRFSKIDRRGKYLLWYFDHHVMISHLGMTGKWRIQNQADVAFKEKHDHVDLELVDGRHIIYNDSRRFGYIDVISSSKELGNHPYFKDLGLEPFDLHLSVGYFLEKASKSERSVKVFIMDQKILVGVGNIYASEILFRAGILPQRSAKTILKIEWKRIIDSIQKILQAAIRSGGSTIKDYRNADGGVGTFQKKHKVYNRKGQNCSQCGSIIQSSFLGGRATYWCPHCQK